MKTLIKYLFFGGFIAILVAGVAVASYFWVKKLQTSEVKDTFALIQCAPGEILKQSTTNTWKCARDEVAEAYDRTQNHINLLQCPQSAVVKNEADGSYSCAVGGIGSLTSGQGVLVTGRADFNDGDHDPVTLGTANGLSLVDQVLSMGTASLTATGGLSSDDFAVFYDKVSSVTAQNGIKNTGSATDPVLEINAGNGLNISSNVLSVIAGNNSIIVDANGVKTRLGLNGGLVVSVDGVTLRKDCSADQIVKWDGYTWNCAADADANTTYTAGEGIQITSNTIANTGVILAPATSARNVITPAAAGATALTLTGHSAQTADLMQIKNTSGTTMVNVTSAGKVGIGDSTPDSELDVEGTIRANDIISKGPIVDVRAYGAVGDGVNDDTAAITSAMNSLPADGGIIYFPTGRYLTTGILINKSNITFRGNGMWNTMITTNTATNAMFEVYAGADVTDLIFENMTINGNDLAAVGIPIYGNEIIGFTRVTGVRFIGSDYGLSLRSANNVVIEKSLFHDLGTGTNNGIVLGYGCRNIVINNNRFLYLLSGITTDTGDVLGDNNEEVTEHVTIQDNYFDLGIYTKLPNATGVGGTVSYTATTVTDTAAAFTSISGYATYDVVKVMPLRVDDTTGAGVTIYGNRVEDTGATFTTAGVMQGDIIKVGTTHMAIVSSVESQTVLWVEEWLTQSDRQLVNPPTTTPYKIYGVFLALAHQIDPTVLTVNSWQSFNGDTVQPSGANWINQDSQVVGTLAGTVYEYLKQTNYAINTESSARYYKILGNTVKRTYSDQISTFGYRFQIMNNYVEYGLDMGITVYGDHNVVANNMVRQSGTSGIIVEGFDNLIQSNMIYGHTWRKVIFNDNILGGIAISTGGRNLVGNNLVDGQGNYPADKGIVVLGLAVGTPTTGNIIKDNLLRDHSLGGVVIVGAYATGTQLFGNTEKVTATDGGVAPDSSTLISETTNTTTLSLKGMSGQTSNLQEWRNSSGNNLAQIAPDGSAAFNIQNGATGTFIVHGAANRALMVDYATNRVGVNTESTPIAGFQIDSTSAGEYSFLVRDSGNDQRFAIDDNGGVRIMSKPATASNVYRSSGTLYLISQYWNGSAAEEEQFQITNTRNAINASGFNALTFYNATEGISPLIIAGGDGGQVAVGFDGPNETLLTTLGQLHVRSRAATTPTLTVQGATSQTASLQKWLNVSSIALAEIDPQGNLKVPHLIGNTVEPAIAAGAGAGTGALVDVVGTDLSGKIVLVTGTTTVANSTLVTITFNVAYGVAPNVVISPADANAAALSGATAVFPESTTTTFILKSGATPPSDSTLYQWTYHVIQ